MQVGVAAAAVLASYAPHSLHISSPTSIPELSSDAFNSAFCPSLVPSQKMSSSIIEYLPSEILLQICELLRNTHVASLYSFSGTSSRVREVTIMVIFQNVKFPIHNHDSVEKDVQSLIDTLEPISAISCIRSLRLCHAWNSPGADQKADWRDSSWLRSDKAPADAVWTYDHAWKPMSHLLLRCPALSDLHWRLLCQIPPCVLEAIHRYHPRSRLHMRAFFARSLLGSEIDKHELAIASSPCLHSIWVTYMESEEEVHASQSQRVVQQVLARLGPNVEEVRFRRFEVPPRGSLPQPETQLPMEKVTVNPSTSLRRLEISASRSPNFFLYWEELKSWHTHVDFSRLHTLILNTSIGLDALRWLNDCDLASLKVLSLQWKDRNGPGNRESKFSAMLFIVHRLPLSELAVGWRFKNMDPIYQRHGASLRTLRLPGSRLKAHEVVTVLQNIRDQCPLLTELEFTIPRDQGSITEVAVYKTFATFPVLRRLVLRFAFMNHTLDAEGRARYDEFDQRRFSEDMVERPRYGDVRRALVDRAIDERFARTVYRLASRASRSCRLDQLELKIDSGSDYPYRLRDASETSLSGVLKCICRSWTVEPGVRDDRPDEVVTPEIVSTRAVKPAPKELEPRVEQVFRRIWPGSEDGTSDWRTDWHSFLECDEATDEPVNTQVGQF